MAKEKSVRLQLFELGISDVLTFPLDRLTTIRAACSTYGLMWDRRFETHTDKEEKNITITRVA